MYRLRSLVAPLLPLALVATSSAGCASSADAEAPVFTADATEVVATFKDGFAARPVGAPRCAGPDATYTLRLPARELETARCGAAPTTRVLSAVEATSLDASLKALRLQTTQRCFSDTPAIRITIKTPSAEKSYRDGESYCSDDGAAYVEGAGAVLAELRELEK